MKAKIQFFTFLGISGTTALAAPWFGYATPAGIDMTIIGVSSLLYGLGCGIYWFANWVGVE